jgi:hypothetical protein
MTLPPLAGFVDPSCGFGGSDLMGEEESDPTQLMDTANSSNGSLEQQQQQLGDKIQQDTINYFDS